MAKHSAYQTLLLLALCALALTEAFGIWSPALAAGQPAPIEQVAATSTAASTGTPTPSSTATPSPSTSPTATPVQESGTLTWLSKAPMPAAKFAMGVSALGGRLYVAGGIVGNTRTGIVVDTVEEYDPAKDSWIPRASMPAPRAVHSLVAASNGRLYAIGGVESGQASDGLTSIIEYDPVSDSWSARAARLPEGRIDMAAASANGKIYIFGGFAPTASVSRARAAFEYDPASDTIQVLPDMPRPRERGAAVTAPNGNIYLLGGGNPNATGEFGITGSVDVYDPATGTWSTTPNMPTPRSYPAAVLASGSIYLLGGQANDYSVLNIADRYDLASGLWFRDTPMPTARILFGAAVGSNGRIYAIGGVRDATSSLDAVEEATIPGAPVPSPTATMTTTATPVVTATPTATTTVPAAQIISLHQGWNWFSLAVSPSDSAVSSVLSSIAGSYDYVLGEAGTFVAAGEPPLNTLSTIQAGRGYMIRMSQEATLSVSGAAVSPSTPIALSSGWNWVGYLPGSARPLPGALSSLSSGDTHQCGYLMGETGTYAPPPAPSFLNTLQQMEPGRGYLIRMQAAGSLVYGP